MYVTEIQSQYHDLLFLSTLSFSVAALLGTIYPLGCHKASFLLSFTTTVAPCRPFRPTASTAADASPDAGHGH